MKRIIVIAGLVVVMLTGAYFSYHWYQQKQLINAIAPHIKNISLRTSNSLNYEIEPSNITVKEVFQNIEADISEIDKRILEVQTVSTPAINAKMDIIMAYLKGCQELLRADLAKNRKSLALKSSIDWANKSVDLYIEASYYGRDYARKRTEEAAKEMNKAKQEYFDAISDLAAAAMKLVETRIRISSIISPDNLVDPNTLTKIIDANKKKDENATAK